MTTPLWKRVIARILEALLAIIFISPLVWVIICSFSPQAGSSQSKGWGVANYLTLFGYQEGLPKYLFNSVIVTLVAVVFSVVVCTLAGYSFSRFDYPGRNLGFMVTLSILMVPYASLLIPLMVWYKQIGLNDSLLGVGLVITLFQLPMSTFIMRNAFDAIPKDMEEAAMVDGCNSLQALFKILVPVVKPSMVTVGLLAFLEAWNNFMIPLYLSSSSKSTLPLAMARLWVEVAPFSSTSVRSTRTRPMSGAHQLSSVPLIVTGALRRDEGEIVRVITVRKRAFLFSFPSSSLSSFAMFASLSWSVPSA